MMFRRTLEATLLLVALSLIHACSPEKTTAAPIVDKGGMAPLWSGTDLVNGAGVNFPAVLNARPAVLIFWATWCPYCKAFMPYARQIQADYASQGVQIITFNAKERGRGDPQAYARELDFPLVAIADADAIAESYGVEFIPGLMVVDGQGKVTYRRGWTELPAGKTVAEQWAGEVRQALNIIIAGNMSET